MRISIAIEVFPQQRVHRVEVTLTEVREGVAESSSWSYDRYIDVPAALELKEPQTITHDVAGEVADALYRLDRRAKELAAISLPLDPEAIK